jgi:exodeoxyribonuclease X
MFIFLDTETTGIGRADRICQLAFKTGGGLVVNELFNPGRAISIEAMATHHITNQMVAQKPLFQGSPAHRQLEKLISANGNVLVAHNARFDIEMLEKDGIHAPRYICTLKLARHLDKNGVIPQYNLQYLRYYLNLNIQATAHDALGDVLVLEGLFERLFKKLSESEAVDPVAEAIRISALPSLLHRMPFGKHKGKTFDEVPPDYLQWLATTDLEDDMAYTVRHYLEASL